MSEVFDFKRLVAKFKQQPAVISDEKTYNYQELYMKAKTVFMTNTIVKDYIVLIARPNIDFICEFLAVHLMQRIPIVVTDDNNYQLAEQLQSIQGQWQWLAEPLQEVKVQQQQLNTLLFLGQTSGTTGTAKLYQRDWLSWKKGFDQCIDIFDMHNYEAIMTTSPIETSLGMHTLMLSLYSGKTFYCFDHHDQPKPLKPTLVFTVPTYLVHGYNHWANNIAIKGVVSCGGELNNELVQNWLTHHHQTLYELYGSAETSLVSWQKIDDVKKQNDVGHLFPEVQISLTAQQRITVRSPYLFRGYLGQQHFILFVVMDDVGYFQDEHLYLLARKSDIINHGGNKIYPSEIEAVLRSVVNEVIVFGVPDAVYGENIIAIVVTKHTQGMLKKHVASCLPKYKWPIRYIFVNEIPRTKQQKISRTLLADYFIKGKWT